MSKWFLRFTFTADYVPAGGYVSLFNRMWKEVEIKADTQEIASQIAEQYVSEHSFGRIEELTLIKDR